jgi:DNA replication and repair protein RecF
MSFIQTLNLTHFRSYNTAALEDLPAGFVVLHGDNGAGKTNILESVSLLAPGRGLRNAKLDDIQNDQKHDQKHDMPWSVSARLGGPYENTRIGTGGDPNKQNRRLIRINGENAKGQHMLGEYLSCVWLTPQMDGLFLDAAASRRRFLDRLVFGFDSGHAGRVTRYENAMRQRSRLLQESRVPDATWLSSLERQIAQTGVSIAAARHDFVQRLQNACDQIGPADESLFPRAAINLQGTIEDLLTKAPAIEVETNFIQQLEKNRPRDSITGGAAIGPHKSDLLIHYANKNMQAAQCSTGEQKALLIGIILAHARLIKANKGHAPILLLDEVAAHLDDRRRRALYDILEALGGQVWLTGTDMSLFAPLQNRAALYQIAHSSVTDRLKIVA